MAVSGAFHWIILEPKSLGNLSQTRMAQGRYTGHAKRSLLFFSLSFTGKVFIEHFLSVPLRVWSILESVGGNYNNSDSGSPPPPLMNLKLQK